MPQNNYSAVQSSFDEEETYLCVLPSSWVIKKGWNKGIPDKLTLLEGADMCYWPVKAAGYRLLEKAKIPSLPIDRMLLSAFRCKIKRSDFHTYNDACKEQKQMEMCSYTDVIVQEKRLKTDKSAANLFTEIPAESQDAPPKMMRNISNAVADAGSVSNDSQEAGRLNDDSFSSDFSPSRIKNIHSQTKSSMQHIPQSRTECTALELQDYTPLDVLSARVENLENQMDRCLLMLSQISAKLDVIGSRNPADMDGQNQIEVMKYVLEPIRSLAELKAIEEKCINDKFVESVICSMGKIHGKHRFTGAGQTVCLQLTDYFVDRRFLREVS